MRQDEPELINAINELCMGNPSPRSIEYLRKLQKPIPHTDDTVFIFGTNFDVDFFNHQKLEQLPGAMSVLNSKDKGLPKYLRLSNALKALALKVGCKVIVTWNLSNGLVNGLTATVLRIEDEKLTMQIDVDENLPHGMECKIFEIEKYSFIVHKMDGTIVVKRLQFPIKLGYATTIDKAQGRTIASLVVDCYNLWKSAQMGVAIGRAICSKGLEIQNFNLVAATLKHPAIVTDFDAKPGIGVQGSKLCCNTRVQCIVNNPAVGAHAFNFQVGLNPAPNMANPIVEINDTDLTMQIEFLYDMNTFISSQLLPNITPR